MQTKPPPPVFVIAVEIMQKNQIFQCLASWFAPLIFQPCCGTNLAEISLANLKWQAKEIF